MEQRRYQNPYRHSFSGFAFEIAAFITFMAVLSLVALFIGWMMGG
jgi:hypothetical protein